VVVGWWGAHDEVALDRQAPWISVAVVGAVVSAASCALWLLSFRRSVAARVLAVMAAVESIPEPAVANADDGRRVRLRAGSPTLFHRPGCALVTGRAVRSLSDRSRGALRPCEACRA
jgi:hypothetical protein